MLSNLILLAALDTTAVRDVPVAPGETLRVTVAGQGPSVVVIPGYIGSAYAFRQVVRPLVDQGLRVVVVEPLGVGASSRPGKSDYSFTAQAHRIGAALDSLGGLGCVPVLAHSTGVSMAFRLALERPDLVCGVVAENGSPVDTVATSSVKKAVRFGFLIRLFAGKGKIRSQIRKGLIETAGDTSWITPALIDSYTAGGAGDLGAVLRALGGMSRAKEPTPIASQLREITVPVHLLVGGAPKGRGISPEREQMLRDSLPALRVDYVTGAGLHIHEEQPDAVVRAVLAMTCTVNALASRGRGESATAPVHSLPADQSAPPVAPAGPTPPPPRCPP